MFAHARDLSLAAVVTAVSLCLTSGGAAAQAVPCGKHDQLTKTLATKYNETRRAMGVVGTSAVMEIFMSAQGSWTMLVTTTNGIACVAAAGENWQDIPRETAGLDS